MEVGAIRRFKRAGLFIVPLVVLGALATPTSVYAECTYNVIPPATEAARSAREIFIGRVIENIGGYEYDFRIRITHVLRGPAHVGDVRRFNNVYPGWPPSQYPLPGTRKHYPPCSPIPGPKGHVIAFALDALAPDGETRYNAASWISGFNPWGHPETTLDEMRRLAALPQTDAFGVKSDPSSNRSQLPSAILALVFSSTFIAVMSWLGRSRRRDRRRT